MSDFKCWNGDNGSTEEDAHEVRALDSHDAAREFAEREWDNSAGECGTEFDVVVRDSVGVERRWRVSVDFDPTFTVWMLQ